ncbi:acyl-CoA thioesterase FadM [Rhodococcus sp. 27YEA15]|uniref:hypothetical protein n=1 Tax=Rhodococcus sp. 27YEA15 TaxID=3156259 RepID=UPI003C79D299
MSSAFSVEWQDSGKPTVVGDVPSAVEVSMSHDGRKLLGSVGDRPQGCDIEPIRSRTEGQWKTLLGNARIPLLERLVREGDSLDHAGTRLWSAAEVIRKATGSRSVTIEWRDRAGDAVTFGNGEGSNDVVVLTFPVRLTDNEERMLAFVIEEDALEEHVDVDVDVDVDADADADADGEGYSVVETSNAGPDILRSMSLFDPMAYGSDVRPVSRSGYPAVSIRFPVGFRDATNIGGSVGFASFALWLGALRERGTGPVSKRIVEDMATGRWGMVTNNSEVFIDANLYTDEIVEGTIWITELTGPDQATTNLNMEWCKVDGDRRIHIGWGAMQTTWVEILSHGVVAARPMPQYFHDFIEPMTTRTGAEQDTVPEKPRDVDRGALIRSAPMVPRNPYRLEEETFETTLQDGNAVGNVYFGNYYIWQARVRDKFLVRSQRESLAARGAFGELRCVHSRVEHLREVMPFDTVHVTMSLAALYEKGMDLEFEYYKVNGDGSRQKLAIGRQQAIWTMPSLPGGLNLPSPSHLPSSLIESIVEAIAGLG